MVDVVVDLDGALLPLDDPGGAGLEVVAHHRLLLVAGREVLVVAAEVVVGAGHLALLLVVGEGLDEHRVLSGTKKYSNGRREKITLFYGFIFLFFLP